MMPKWTTLFGVRGQTLVETALVLPLFILVVSGIIVFGIGVFYQQQVTNVAREGARYVAIHSATSLDCPVGSWRDVSPAMLPADTDPTPCEGRGDGWPGTHTHARQFGFGLNPNDLHLTACWSGWWEGTSWDAGPTNATTGDPNVWRECSMEGGTNPISETGSLSCPSNTADGDDQASNLATSSGVTANRVTVYACYRWTPPMAGFLGIPDEITFRAVITEALQHQR
jgi:hypothetical protein